MVGKSEPVVVHEILGFESSCPPSWKACVEAFSKARELYLAGDFAKAREGFLACQDSEPWYGTPGVKTCPSKVFARRCERYLEDPPESWDGVFTATEK